MSMPAVAESSIAPGARARWQSIRIPVLAGAALVLVSVALAVLAGRGATGQLDPDSYEPQGSRAAAELLREQGVQVHVARTVAEVEARADGATLLITHPQLVPQERLGELADGAEAVVLVRPGTQELETVGAAVFPVAAHGTGARPPACDLPAAQRAGEVDLGGVEYLAPPGTSSTACYPPEGEPTNDGAALIRAGRITVLGDGKPMTNDRIDDRGNAALVLSLLGERTDLVWYRPALDDPALADGGSKPLHVLLPDEVKVALLQLAIAGLVIAAWRGRRLGPVVAEPLPVVVRASEATEGLARLYRRAGARDRAATALREASVRSAAPRFGMSPTTADPTAVTEAVARHTGRAAAEVGHLLYGGTPDDDAALVCLADDLDTLDLALRSTRTPKTATDEGHTHD